jgi:hypothetical protein
MKRRGIARLLLAASLTTVALTAEPAGAATGIGPLQPTVGTAAAADTSPPLRSMQPIVRPADFAQTTKPLRPQGPVGDERHVADGALQETAARPTPPGPLSGPLFTFEGPSNTDNFNIFGFRVNPPDPVGDVGQHHYVAMVNLVFAVYSKTGTLLGGPFDTGTLWQDFPIEDCTDPSGDPIVLYDEISNRWYLTQFTTRFTDVPEEDQFYNCVAVSTTSDPLGSYHRYAFPTGNFFPDYPKYGVMPNGLYITTREFGPTEDDYQIGIYAINRHQLVEGDPNPTVVSFYLTAPPVGTDPLYLMGDGLLPADLDGKRMPPPRSPEYFAGTMDDGAFYGAPFDAINFFEANVNFAHPANSTFALTKQLPVAPFDSIYPCGVVPGSQPPSARDCLPQPGVTDGSRYLDILSYRQRPTWRLQYRNFRTHESLVTNQSVEAAPSHAGVRWYELRNPRDPVIHQQGTYAPADGVHRWMGSVAMDKQGNLAAGYSVVNGTDVFPGVRYTGRLASDPLGQLTQPERVLQAGSGVQTTLNSRWGDYTSLNVDPRDDCTFYYINEYYTAASQATSPAGWLNRIGAFKFPGCR